MFGSEMPPRMTNGKPISALRDVLVALLILTLIGAYIALLIHLRQTGHRVEVEARAQQEVSPQRFLKHVSYAWDGKVCYSIFYPQANTYFQPLPVKDSACGH